MKKKFLLLMMALVMFLIGGTVRAAEGDEVQCKPTQLNELRQMAANVKVTYLPVSVKETAGYNDPETGSKYITRRYLDIKIYNMTTKLNLSVKNSGGLDKVLNYSNMGVDGSITLRQESLSTKMDYTFTLRSDMYGCSNETLRTIKLTLPRFNYYSELDICSDIPDYYLCQQYTTYKVDGSTFYDRVDEYKAKLLTQSEGGLKEDEDNTGVVSKAVSAISKYKYVFVGIVVAGGVVATVLILRKKKGAKK